jgi:hypothetical protein
MDVYVAQLIMSRRIETIMAKIETLYNMKETVLDIKTSEMIEGGPLTGPPPPFYNKKYNFI